MSSNLTTGTNFLKERLYDKLLRIWYRVCVINDFTETRSFISFFKSGEHEDFVACEVGGEHKGYQEKDDGIHIFLNFNKIALVKSKAEAKKILDKLYKECPKEAKKDYEQYKDILYKSLT